MESLSKIDLGISRKLKDRGYRHRFFKRKAQDEIASQIRELRVRRSLKQKDLAVAMGTGQSAIARIEDATYSGWSFATLQKVAETLDARLEVVFEPMEDVLRKYERREKYDAELDLSGAETGSFPQRPRAFQGITTPEQEQKEISRLLSLLGPVPTYGYMPFEQAAASIASITGREKARAITDIFGRRSDEAERNPTFASR